MTRLRATVALIVLVAIVGGSITLIHRGADARLPDGSAQPQGVPPFFPYDFNEDGCSDITVTDRNNQNEVKFFPSTCDDVGYLDPVSKGLSVVADQLFIAGDWNKDGCADVLSKTGDQMGVHFLNCPTAVPGGGDLGGGWAAFDFIVASGDWNSDTCPDIIARQASDKSLVLFGGNCGADPQVDPGVVIGTGWGIFDWLGAIGDFDGDFCTDMIARRSDDSTMKLYLGDCVDGFQDPPLELGFGWSGFDGFMAGGNWNNFGHGTFLACPDLLGFNPDRSLHMYVGDCQGGIFSQAPHFTLRDFPQFELLADSGPARGGPFWGDVDCDGAVTSRDNQATVRFVLQQNPLSQTQPCPEVGEGVAIAAFARTWGDDDCDIAVTSRDNQAKLRFILQQTPLSQTDPCFEVGDAIELG